MHTDQSTTPDCDEEQKVREDDRLVVPLVPQEGKPRSFAPNSEQELRGN